MSRVIFNDPWHNGVDLCATVHESHAALPIDSYSGYILDPVSSVKGVQIQEGSLHSVFYALGIPSWGTFTVATFPGGVWAPFFGVIPSFWFKCESVLDAATSGQSRMK